MQPAPALTRVAVRTTLWHAGAGLGIAAVMAASLGLWPVFLAPAVWLGALACFLSARWSGRWLAPRIAAGPGLRAALLGALQALACLVCGVVFGSCPGLVQGIAEIAHFGVVEWLFSWLVKPLYWVLLFGSLPATLLGVSCGLLVRRRMRSLTREVLAVAGRDDSAGRQDPYDRHEREQHERD